MFKVNKETVTRLKEEHTRGHRIEQLKTAIVAVYGCSSVGGALHIVLDDENIEDHHIRWCVDECIPKEPEDTQAIYRECARLLLETPLKLREKIVHGYGRDWGFDDREEE